MNLSFKFFTLISFVSGEVDKYTENLFFPLFLWWPKRYTGSPPSYSSEMQSFKRKTKISEVSISCLFTACNFQEEAVIETHGKIEWWSVTLKKNENVSKTNPGFPSRIGHLKYFLWIQFVMLICSSQFFMYRTMWRLNRRLSRKGYKNGKIDIKCI